MTHPLDSGSTACYLFCREFIGAITQDTRGRNFAKASGEIKQHLHDLLTFTHSYVREKCTLRLEEVVTIDALRHHVPTQLEELEVFVPGTTTLLTKALLENHVLYKISNWRKYVELCVKRDFDILRETVYSEQPSSDLLMPYNKITQAMRAEFRLNYFVHGDNVAYGYQLMRNVFLPPITLRARVLCDCVRPTKTMTTDEIISRSSVAFYHTHAYRLSVIFGI